jgi:hypothetical protein
LIIFCKITLFLVKYPNPTKQSISCSIYIQLGNTKFSFFNRISPSQNPILNVKPPFARYKSHRLILQSCLLIHQSRLLIHQSRWLIHQSRLLIHQSCLLIHQSRVPIHQSCWLIDESRWEIPQI